MTEPDFVCAICRREIDMQWSRRSGPDRILPPICLGCEKHYGSRAPEAGAFMDRRKAVQISALTEALANCASIKKWEARHGRA